MQCHIRAMKDMIYGVAQSHGACFRATGKIVAVLALTAAGVKLYNMHKKCQRRQRWNNAGKNIVVLHQFDRGTTIPNLSPFALKLETYMRMTNIKYIVDIEEPMGSVRGKCPWITLNGEEFSDSELIMDHLSRTVPQPFGEFSPEQHALGRAVQVMLDEHTVLFIAYKRYILDNMKNVYSMVSKKYANYFRFMKFFFWRKFRNFFWMIGVGRFNEQEVMFFMFREIEALSNLLGNKQFLLGDNISVYDAAVFAELTQILYGCAPEVERKVRDKYANLVQYHDRMKGKYWPDWEQCRSQ